MVKREGNYKEDGYSLFREVFTPEEVAKLQSKVDEAIENLPETQTVYEDGEYKEAPARPEKMTEPHPHNAFWLSVCLNPRILDAVESVLGPNLILIMSHLIVKPPEDGLPVAWHQDNTYWHTVKGREVGTVWLAIDDADVSNGCMQVILGSHQDYPEMEKVKTEEGDNLLGLTVEVTEDMISRVVPLGMKAGSLSIHDSYLVHGSEENASDRRRAAYTMRYANPHKVEISTEEHWVPVYLVRGDGGEHEEKFIDARPGCEVPIFEKTKGGPSSWPRVGLFSVSGNNALEVLGEQVASVFEPS